MSIFLSWVMVVGLHAAVGLVDNPPSTVESVFPVRFSNANATATTTHTTTLPADAVVERDWDTGKDRMNAGIDLVVNAVDFVNDPSVSSAGSALQAMAGVAALVPAPPASLIVAGVLGLAGSLMSLFGGGNSPSNQDIMDRLDEGFKVMEAKLDNIQTDVTLLLKLVDDIYRYFVSGVEKMNEIHSEYRSYTNYLEEAAKAQSPQVFLDEAKRIAIEASQKWENEVNNIFDKNQVRTHLEHSGNNYVQKADAYEVIIGARYELFALMFAARTFQHGVDDVTAYLVNELRDQLEDYKGLVRELHVPISGPDRVALRRQMDYPRWTKLTSCCMVPDLPVAANSKYVFGYGSKKTDGVYRATSEGHDHPTNTWRGVTSPLPDGIRELSVTDNYVYASSTKGGLYRAPVQGGSWKRIICSSCWIGSIAADDQHVYGIGTDNQIWRVPSSGVPANGEHAWQKVALGSWKKGKIKVDQGWVYALGDDCKIYRTRKESKDSNNFEIVGDGCMQDFDVDDHFIYGLGQDRKVYRCPKSGVTGHNRWVRVLDQCCVNDIAVDGKFIYGLGSDGIIWKMATNAEAWWFSSFGQFSAQNTTSSMVDLLV